MARRKRDELQFFEREFLKEVHAMFRALNASYDRLADKTGISKESIEFGGFDANDSYESRFNGYSGRNSPGRMMPYYERLLEEWKRASDRENLTRDEILLMLRGATLRY